MKTTSLVPVIAVCAFSVSFFGLPDVPGPLGTPSAAAKSEKGDRGNNGHGRGAGGAESSTEVSARGNAFGNNFDLEDPPGRGHIARELKNMNAANALKNGKTPSASPTSNVGQIIAYRDALLGNQALIDQYGDPAELAAIQTEALNTLSTYGVVETDLLSTEQVAAERLAALQGAIDALDPASATYEADLGALQAEKTAIETALTDYQGATTNLAALDGQIVDDAGLLEDVTRGRSIGEEAMAAFRDMLGLD